MSKVFVIVTTKNGIQYKRYKCIDGWSRNPDECWQFSKQGGERIAARLNKGIAECNKRRIHYSTLEVERVYQ